MNKNDFVMLSNKEAEKIYAFAKGITQIFEEAGVAAPAKKTRKAKVVAAPEYNDAGQDEDRSDKPVAASAPRRGRKPKEKTAEPEAHAPLHAVGGVGGAGVEGSSSGILPAGGNGARKTPWATDSSVHIPGNGSGELI